MGSFGRNHRGFSEAIRGVLKMYEKAILKISHTEAHTDLLGPGDRFVIWVHGCCFDCEGCLARNTRFGPYSEVETGALAMEILNSGCDGITISGGEPFLQAEPLAALVREVRRVRDMGVIVYSGFTLSELRERSDSAPLLRLTDILIDGRYVKALDDGSAYIGSSNQTLHYLTERYRASGEGYYSAPRRRAEIRFSADSVTLIGVPSANVLTVWKQLKSKNGGGEDDF